MLIVVAACGAALMWAMKATPALVSPAVHSSARVPYESIWRGTLFLAALAALWGALWLTVFSRPTALLVQERPSLAAPQRPGLFNVLLVVLDTVRADHLDLFDYQRETMPNLRRFARDECQVSMRIITTAPWTAPSHASMFTGLYASAHGAHYPFLSDESPAHVGYPLREDIPTLAEFLDAHGYRTAGIAANFVVLSSFGLLRGFEYSDASPGSAHLAATAAWLYRARFGKWPSPGEVVRDWLPAALQRRAALLNRRQPPYRRAREITDSAVRWLDGNADQPFFLFLNYLDAHTPYFPPAEDEERFASRPAGEEWLGFPHERYRARTWGRGAFTPEEEAFLIGQYDAQLFSLDREFGRLLQHLRDSGLMENTLILVTTDHGESLFEHDFLGHGATLYGPEINGFLLAKAPAGLGEIQPSPLMQFVDFFPTIAAAIGAPVPPHVQGSPWGHGRDYALSELFCRDCGYPTSERHEKFRRELVAVIREDRKLIRSTREPDEVYDLASDPGELKPLDELDAGFSERAEAVLRQRKIALLEEVTENQPTDEDLLKKMRTLGYVK
jgi:arylsulfatase A-like enzyme